MEPSLWGGSGVSLRAGEGLGRHRSVLVCFEILPETWLMLTMKWLHQMKFHGEMEPYPCPYHNSLSPAVILDPRWSSLSSGAHPVSAWSRKWACHERFGYHPAILQSPRAKCGPEFIFSDFSKAVLDIDYLSSHLLPPCTPCIILGRYPVI